MKQIPSFDDSRLQVPEAFNFFLRVDEAAKATLKLESDKAMVNDYHAAVVAFDDVLVKSRKNSQTATQQEADKAFDKIYQSARTYANAMSGHPTAAVATAGKTLYEIFEKYGNIVKLNYDKEYSYAHNLVQDLEALTSEQMELLHFAPWYEALVIGVATFTNARTSKTLEDATYITGLVEENRLATSAAYKNLVLRVNALAVVNGEEPYAQFINFVTQVIEDAKALIKQRDTRNAKKKEEEEDETDDTATDDTATDGTTTDETTTA